MSRFPGIPDPQPSVDSMYETIIALKQTVEVLSQQRQPKANGCPSWQDLVDLGIITATDIPA